MQGEVECQMDRCGANDKRALARCNFCGSVEGLRCYPTDILGVDWYACEDCVALTRDEDWKQPYRPHSRGICRRAAYSEGRASCIPSGAGESAKGVQPVLSPTCLGVPRALCKEAGVHASGQHPYSMKKWARQQRGMLALRPQRQSLERGIYAATSDDRGARTIEVAGE